MDMTATAEAARSWYENPRLGGSPNSTGLSSGASGHQSVSSGSTGLDGPDMGAFYALESSGHHRRYYSAGYHHSHSKCMSPFIATCFCVGFCRPPGYFPDSIFSATITFSVES